MDLLNLENPSVNHGKQKDSASMDHSNYGWNSINLVFIRKSGPNSAQQAEWRRQQSGGVQIARLSEYIFHEKESQAKT